MKRVLLVDDEADIRLIARLALEALGPWTVFDAPGGEEGLTIVAEEHPDLVLLDVMMPDLDGPGTLTRLRGDPKTRGIPVIFMTAKTQRIEVDRFLELGAAGVITKPFDPMTLADEIRRILGWGTE